MHSTGGGAAHDARRGAGRDVTKEHLQGLEEEAIGADQELDEAHALYCYLTVPEQKKYEAQLMRFITGKERRQAKMKAHSLEIAEYSRRIAEYTAMLSDY